MEIAIDMVFFTCHATTKKGYAEVSDKRKGVYFRELTCKQMFTYATR
jgi:hypothetical protein